MRAAIIRLILVSICFCGIASSARAQVVFVPGFGHGRGRGHHRLRISANPFLVTFQLVSGGTAHGSSPVSITTSWRGRLCLSTCTVSVYAYFTDANAALSGGSPGMNIPSSAVLGQVPTGIPTRYTPFTQTNPFGGAAGLEIFSQTYFRFAGHVSRTDALNLEIDLSNLPRLPAGNYNGTLFIQAQVF